jgi:hypothetical protein
LARPAPSLMSVAERFQTDVGGAPGFVMQLGWCDRQWVP